FQAGAGVSFNMNANEVIANRAIEIMGGNKGDYTRVHPNDHANMSQSTNDVYPTALRLAALVLVNRLAPRLDDLERTLLAKSVEFQDVIKPGRTHLQDAVPVKLGREFAAYAVAVHRGAERLRQSAKSLEEIGLGGTAVGTGVNTPPGYREAVARRLSELTGLDLRPATDPIEATQSTTAFVEVSAALKTLALDLIRIANDLRLMNSGPNTALAEINLPAVQPGSSIMPGKVNPVMPELLDMVCFQVVGNDLAIALAAQAGQLELNVMTPVIAFDLLQSLEILGNATKLFAERCIRGITANRERCVQLAERSLAMATVLNRYIGYEKAAQIAQQSLATGRSPLEIVLDKRLLPKEQAARAFDLDRLAQGVN
ncbi:MAG: aspartate ammonia-lyase, partial [Chloroflexi bacterium]|nr:aspartate ammonia-lyase [Chloroflexota bacterium]